jgi:deazaflavin-dependent oxidoreductase (nitroreductase family)
VTGERGCALNPHKAYLRWLYRSGRPNRLARLLNRGSAIAHSAGIWPTRLATLEVPGRRTGRLISFPVVIANYDGERYLVAMLGEHTNWVRNVRAAGGRAVLRHGHREAVRLKEVDPAARPPILRRYLACAPGARPHIPVDRHAPLEDFEQVAPQIPVLRITTEHAARHTAG